MKTLRIAIRTALLIALVLIAFLLGKEHESKTTVDMIVSQFGFNEIGELNTAEFYFTMVEEYEGNSKKIFDIEIPFTAPKFTYSVDGYVKAGIDFSDIKVDIADKKTIVVSMPKPEITEAKLDLNTMKIFEETKGLFNSVRVNDTAIAELELEAKAKELAKTKGIITMAEENAKSVIEKIINTTTDNKYSIIFKQLL